MPSSTSSSDAQRWGAWPWRGVLFFAFAFAMTLEVTTRIDHARLYGIPFFEAYSYDRALMEHDELGIKGRSGGIYEKWRMNSLGLRGPEAAFEPGERGRRVVALGASETFGLYETPGSEWPRALERELLRQGVQSEVLNGALAGMTAGAQLRHLRLRLMPLKPDVVVWVVHYSIFAALDRGRLSSMELVIPPDPGPPTVAERMSPRIIPRLRNAIMQKLPEGSRNFIDEMRFEIQLARQRAKSGDAFGGLTQVTAEELEAFEYFVASVNAEVRAAGASLVIVLPPRRLDPKSLRLQYLSFPQVSLSWMEDAFSKFTRSVVEAEPTEGFRVLNLQGLFGTEISQFMWDTVHFTDAGALTLAKRIAPCVATGQCEPSN